MSVPETKLLSISSIKKNPDNPRIIKDDKFKKLVESVKTFPQMLKLRPVVVDSNMVILGGNMRYEACKAAGYTEIPVLVADDLTEEQKREFVIKDNVSGGEWDWSALANEWDVDLLTEWGLDMPDFTAGEELEAEEDDFDATLPDEPITVFGDLYEIGEHRLLCGDSTNVTDVERLMDGDKAELLFTSPPYSDMRDYNGNKNLDVNNIIEFIPTFYPFADYQVINLGLQRKDNEIVEYWNPYIYKAKECGMKLLSWNVWDKTQGGSIASATAMFLLTHEWIFVFGDKPKDINRTIPNQIDKYEARHGKDWRNGRSNHPVRQKDGSIGFTSTKTYSHHQLHSCIQQTPELSDIRKQHPATFPVGLPSEYIKAMTNNNKIVCEPFCGSGTTMVASHQLKRRCYGMELDPKYCDVIINRMHKLDPSLTIKRNGVPHELPT